MYYRRSTRPRKNMRQRIVHSASFGASHQPSPDECINELVIDGDASGLVFELPVSDDFEDIPDTEDAQPTTALVLYTGQVDEEIFDDVVDDSEEVYEEDDTIPLFRQTEQLEKLHRRLAWTAWIGCGVFVACLAWFLVVVAVPWFFYPTATVTITPQTQHIADLETVPLASIGGFVVGTHDQSEITTVATSGEQTQQAAKASGMVTLINTNNAAQRVQAGALITAQNGVAFTTDYAVVVPEGFPTGTVTVSVHAEAAGPSGNISAGMINGPCCLSGITARNAENFSGGQDMQTFQAVAQSDINATVQTLAQKASQDTATVMQQGLSSGEKLIEPLACQQNVSADHKAGEKATKVTVRVLARCQAMAYHMDQAFAYATQHLTQKAFGYMLATSTVTFVAQTLDDKQVRFRMSGFAFYNWSEQQLRCFAQHLTNKTIGTGIASLSGQSGVYAVSYSIWGRNQTVFPSDASRIHVTVKPLLVFAG